MHEKYVENEILGHGSLFGRFQSEPVKPMTDYWGAELALRSARYYKADLPEDIAPVVSARCGGNPFYITAVVRQSVKRNKRLTARMKPTRFWPSICHPGSFGRS